MDNKFNILIFNKDRKQGESMREQLKFMGQKVQAFDSENEAYHAFAFDKFNICIIQYHPLEKGVHTLSNLIRGADNPIPIIYLLDQPSREDLHLLFSLEADDVIRIPFDYDVLLARIKAILRRYEPESKQTAKNFHFGKFKFESQKQLLKVEDRVIKLTTKESELLHLLCLHGNDVVDRSYILHIIWKSDNYFNARSMDVYITKLRKILQEDPLIKIINYHGKGYKLSTHGNDE